MTAASIAVAVHRSLIFILPKSWRKNMRPYFEKMNELGMQLKDGQIKSTEANVVNIKDVESQVDEAVEKELWWSAVQTDD